MHNEELDEARHAQRKNVDHQQVFHAQPPRKFNKKHLTWRKNNLKSHTTKLENYNYSLDSLLNKLVYMSNTGEIDGDGQALRNARGNLTKNGGRWVE
mgnify:CR=1 FL=1